MLLTWVDKDPLLTKKGILRVQQPPAHKDKTAESYHTQCIHDGIKPFKTWPPAKKTRLEAFAAQHGRLAVPQSFLDIDKKLKRDFAEANAAAKRKQEAVKLERQEQLKEEADEEGERRQPCGRSVGDIREA